MIFKSKRADLQIDQCNVLDHLFPEGQAVSETPIWIDADDDNNSLSPRQMLVWVRRIGLGLQRLGVGMGDSVLVFTPNHIFIPAAYLGTVCLGAAFSGASPAFTAAELVHQMKICGNRVMLVHPSLLKTATAAIDQLGFPRDRVWLFSDVQTTPQDGLTDWRNLMASEQDSKDWRWQPFTPQQALSVVGTVNFSSGTTGMPKGVAVTHANLIANITQIASIFAYDNERWCTFLPLYHAYGQLYAVLIVTKNNIPIHIMRTFNLTQYLDIIKRHRITRMQTVPPILIMLDKRPEAANADLSSVKEIICGAAPLSKELEQTIQTKFKVRISQGWGLSETTCAATGIPFGWGVKLGCSGMLLPNTEMRLIDDEGKEVSYGERGEAYLRGPQIAKEYWKNTQATADTFEDGWLKTGDIAIIQEDGYMWIVDRKKELIKVKGLQVSPAELEAVLLEHPQIDDAAVVGITIHDDERPRAYVKLAESAQGKLSEQDIQAWIKPRVAKHKALDGGVVLIPEVPKLASGKIQRKVMREWAKRDALAIESQQSE